MGRFVRCKLHVERRHEDQQGNEQHRSSQEVYRTGQRYDVGACCLHCVFIVQSRRVHLNLEFIVLLGASGIEEHLQRCPRSSDPTARQKPMPEKLFKNLSISGLTAKDVPSRRLR